MIRCNNCGWSNSPSNVRCEKCNAPLKGSMVAGVKQSEPVSAPAEKYSPATELGKEAATPYWDQQNVRNCPSCGYPNMADATQCIKCKNTFSAGAPVSQQASSAPQQKQANIHIFEKEGKSVRIVEGEGAGDGAPASFNKTIDPYRQVKKVKCYLEPIQTLDENAGVLIECVGTLVPLNRESLDPGNNTITSKVQAVIKSENGVFTIEDKSDMQTTFVQVNKPHVLQKGDIVLMGDKKFRFWTDE